MVIMNESGEVLFAELVPCDERALVIKALEDIIQTQDKDPASLPTCITTDNIANDGNKLEVMCNNLLPNKKVHLTQAGVHDISMSSDIWKQDVFHVLQRIIREMQRSHPDFVNAKKHLSGIFQKIIKGEYGSDTEYVEDMELWISRWSDPHRVSTSDAKERVLNLGEFQHFESMSENFRCFNRRREAQYNIRKEITSCDYTCRKYCS